MQTVDFDTSPGAVPTGPGIEVVLRDRKTRRPIVSFDRENGQIHLDGSAFDEAAVERIAEAIITAINTGTGDLRHPMQAKHVRRAARGF